MKGRARATLPAGHRRAAAAVAARWVALAGIVRPDLSLDGADDKGDRTGQAGHVGAMLAENTHCAGLTAVEEARGAQAMLDLGVSLAKVANTNGLGRRRVAKAAGAARLEAGASASGTRRGAYPGAAGSLGRRDGARATSRLLE